MQLLQDVFIIENLQIISESKGKGPTKIKGVFGRCNEKNNNGRIYPRNVLEGQLKQVQPLIAERRLCGELDHPQNDTVKLSNASHLITTLDLVGNEYIGEAELLNTPAGLTAKALVEGGVKIGISSRGMGTLSEDSEGNKIVNEDYKLVTFDLVADPSTRGAFPGMCESTENQFVRESQSKLKKEGNLVTMLQSKLREAYQPWIISESDPKHKRSRSSTRARITATQDALKRAPVLKNNPKGNDKTTDTIDAAHRSGAREGNRAAGGGDVLGRERPKGLSTPTGKAAENRKKKLAGKRSFISASYSPIAHALASILREDFGTELKDEAERRKAARELISRQPSGSGKSGPGFRDRLRIKAGKRAEAEGDVQASRIRARGEAGGDVGLRAKLGLGGAGSADYSDKSKAMLQKKADALKPKDSKRTVAGRKPGETRTVELQADRNKLAKQLRARLTKARKNNPNDDKAKRKKYIGGARGAATQAKDRFRKEHGKTEAVAYKRIGNIIAEMLYLKEDSKKGYPGIKGGTPEAAERQKKLKSREQGSTRA